MKTGYALLTMAFALLFGTAASAQTTRFVATNSPDPDSLKGYTNWACAATNINDAIGAAANGDVIVVTNGLYDTGGRVFYSMTNRVVINKRLTVRSVNGPAVTIIKGAHHSATVTNGPNAVRCVGVDHNDAKLIGFTLTNGATLTGPDAIARSGGALTVWSYVGTGPVVVSNCWMLGNCSDYTGGAVYGALPIVMYNCLVVGNSTMGSAYGVNAAVNSCVLHDCTVSNNFANGYGAGVARCRVYNSVITHNTTSSGAGAYLSTLFNSFIEYNYATWDGGGTQIGTNINCTIRNNRGDMYFGGVSGGSTDGDLGGACYNCIIYNNTGPSSGARGGSGVGNAELYNCLVYGNTGGTAAIRNSRVFNSAIVFNTGGGVSNNVAGRCVTNSIVYFNTPYNWRTDGALTPDGASIGYSCTTPLPAGPFNKSGDPMFADPAANNFRLKPGSPCLNNGLNMDYMSDPADPFGRDLDLDNGPRIRHHNVDMGPYELRVARGTMFCAD